MPVWPPHSIRINPDAVRQARIAALTAGKTLGEWLGEAIQEKQEREDVTKRDS